MFLSPSDFRAIVSGQRRGLTAALWRCLFAAVEIPYALAVWSRNRRYDRGWKVHRADVPVISVGNLTLGGTGKTPFVEWLARWFRSRQVRVCIISRGYGAEEKGPNDEALQLERNLPDVPHLENPDRIAASQVAVEELQTQLILLDDGFQHRRLGRDLDIVLLDALEPFGWRHVFPRGTLREPLSGLGRAGVIALSRAEALSEPQREQIRAEALRRSPQAIWVEVTHAPTALRNSSGKEIQLGELAGKKVAAFCGIGNPAAFRLTLDGLGYEVAGFREFDDHYNYRRDDVKQLMEWSHSLGAEAVVCTEKDLVKLAVDQLGELPVWAVRIEIQFLAGQDALQVRLEEIVQTMAGPSNG